MLWNCLKCRKKQKVNIQKKMLLSKCEVFDTKKPKFNKEQEASGLLSSLGIKTPLSKITIVCRLLL